MSRKLPRQKTPTSQNGKPADYRKLYYALGVNLNVNGSGEAIADECPYCGKTKFYVNLETGLYDCKHCHESGNTTTYLRHYHSTCLEQTTDAHYRQLKAIRDLPLQTLKRHRLAFDEAEGHWLIPFNSTKGEPVNLLSWEPPAEDGTKGKPKSMPGLPLCLYGVDQLSDDPTKPILLCEGPWDAIALDFHLRENKTRTRYDILAVPGCGTFKPEWTRFFARREVRLLYDNDDAGREGQGKAAKVLREADVPPKSVYALEWPVGYPDGCDVRDLVRDKVPVVEFARQHSKLVASREPRQLFKWGSEIQPRTTQWLWPGHIPLGSLVSFSGPQGTGKSTIARDIAARVTAGLPMPGCAAPAIPAGPVLYFTSEDSAPIVQAIVAVHGGNVERLAIHDIAEQDEPLDVLNHLDDLESEINSTGAKLVILDAFNSFVGGDAKTDAKARTTITGKLQSLARRTGACIMGLRNWGRHDTGSSTDRTLGAISIGHVARCCMNTTEQERTNGQRSFVLEFEKVSDAPRPPPLAFHLEDRSTGQDDKHLRCIVWKQPIDIAATIDHAKTRTTRATRPAKCPAKKGSKKA